MSRSASISVPNPFETAFRSSAHNTDYLPDFYAAVYEFEKICYTQEAVTDKGMRSMPDEFHDDVHLLTKADAALPMRDPDTHKGDYGKILIVAGSPGCTGAPSFAARAAVRSGAGLVFLAVPESIWAVEAVKNDEAMVIPLPADHNGHISRSAIEPLLKRLGKCDACLAGPGLGLSEGTESLVVQLLSSSRVPLILDADGITCAAAHIDILDKASCPVILTPHEGEFRRLCPEADQAETVPESRAFAIKHHVILVRKSHRTVIAYPDGTVFRNTTGNAGMAKGGSGDVLAGMLLGLVGQGLSLKHAVNAGVYLHGRAGDQCAARFGEYAMTPSDMVMELKNVMR